MTIEREPGTIKTSHSVRKDLAAERGYTRERVKIIETLTDNVLSSIVKTGEISGIGSLSDILRPLSIYDYKRLFANDFGINSAQKGMIPAEKDELRIYFLIRSVKEAYERRRALQEDLDSENLAKKVNKDHPWDEIATKLKQYLSSAESKAEQEGLSLAKIKTILTDTKEHPELVPVERARKFKIPTRILFEVLDCCELNEEKKVVPKKTIEFFYVIGTDGKKANRTSIEKVLRYREDHPNATAEEIVNATRVSPGNTQSYLDNYRLQDGVAVPRQPPAPNLYQIAKANEQKLPKPQS